MHCINPMRSLQCLQQPKVHTIRRTPRPCAAVASSAGVVPASAHHHHQQQQIPGELHFSNAQLVSQFQVSRKLYLQPQQQHIHAAHNLDLQQQLQEGQCHDQWQQQQQHATAAFHHPGAAGVAAGSGRTKDAKKQHSLAQTMHALRSSSSSSSSAAGAAGCSPHLLTSAITQCETLDDVLQVFGEMSAAFNNVHVAAMVARLPKILRRAHQQQQQQQQHAPWQQQHLQQQQQQQDRNDSVTSSLTHSDQQDLQQLLSDLSQLSEELLPTCSPREMVNISWGFAALGFQNRRLLQLLLGRCTLAALNPQELSNLAWAVAKLGHEVPSAWVDQVLQLSGRVLEQGRFNPQEAANLAWALAVLQQQCLEAGVSRTFYSSSSNSGGGCGSSCVRVGPQWKQGLARLMDSQLGLWTAPDISQALWALAVLGLRDVQQQWLDRVLVRGLQLLGQDKLQSRHAATMLWAVAKFHQQQQQWAAGSSSSTSQGLVSPTVSVFAAAVASKLPVLLVGEQQPLHFASVLLCACQQLRLQLPAAAVDVLLAAVTRQLGSLDFAAVAAHEQAAAAAEAGSSINHSTSSSSSSSSSRRTVPIKVHSKQQRQQQQQKVMLDLCMMLHSLTKLSYRPKQQVMDMFAAVVADQAWHVVDCHDTLAELGRAWHDLHQQRQQRQQEQQGHQQQQVAESAVIASRQQQILQHRQQLLHELHSTLRGRETSLLLWSMAKLRYQPPATLLRPLKMACLRQRVHFNASDVSVMMWSLARMRHKPGYLWVRFMLEHFLARIDDRVGGAADVCNVVHALPHLPGGENQRYVLRHKVGREVLQGLADAAAARFSESGPRELVQLAQGFALLGFNPGSTWLAQHQQRVGQVGQDQFSRRERAILQKAWKLLSAQSAADESAPAEPALAQPGSQAASCAMVA